MALVIRDHQNPSLNFSTELQDMELRRRLFDSDAVGAVRQVLDAFGGDFVTGDFAIYRQIGLAITSTDKLGSIRRVDMWQVPSGSPSSIGSAYRQLDIIEDPANDVEWTTANTGTGAGGDALTDVGVITNGDIASALGHTDYMEVRQTDA